ncbi:MAG: amino acid adenylation domain-containing protein, partial [Phaeodactylibacter sp.]|nr:amino acid adenylation domain-containing protein [Phaeodactylibacter sp.]
LYRQSAAYQEDQAFWLEKFSELPENLFEARNRQVDKSNRSARKELYIPRAAYDRLNTVSRQLGATTFHLILALLFVYFSRRQGNRDFVIGLPVLNRGKAAFKKTVGLFMGVSLLRMAVDPACTLGDLVAAIRKQLREDYRHQRFPLGKLIQQLQGFQEKDRLFNLTLSYEKQNYAEHFMQTRTTVIPLTHQAERVALAVYIREFDEAEAVKIDFDYNLNYFDAEMMADVAAQFEHLLQQALEAPDRPLGQYAILRDQDQSLQLDAFNRTERSLPPVETLLPLFATAAQGAPNKIALRDRHQSISYEALDRLTDSIAARLLQREPKALPVGVLMSRSAYTVAVLLGILKAGKPYIPLDPSFPEERLKYIQEHSGLSVLISDASDKAAAFEQVEVVDLKELLAEARMTAPQGLPQVTGEQTAYIIYTSGSTGRPKGVEIGHHALLNFLWSMQQPPGLETEDLLYAVTTYAFDISILEFFLPLITGATVYVADQETLDDYQQTILSITQVAPTVIQATPSFFQLLVNGGWAGAEKLKLLCGGDLLSEELAGQLLQRGRELWNMYGPTETTIWSTIQQITRPEQAADIGKPIANTQCYVLDEQQQLVPLGSIGVLHIAGDGVAKGYFKAPELTAEKFVANPFGTGRLYHTNDLVRWTRTGTLEFLGRNDNQVKIRGYRIELGDVEAQLHRIPELRQAVVVACRQRGQEAFLAAYVLRERSDFDLQACLPLLEQCLPAYMVPRALIPVDAFPLTPNKKIDRKALAQRPIQSEHSATAAAPVRGIVQEQLATFWQEVLDLEQPVGPADNFFALGGHSLNAVRLTERINTQLNYQIGLKAIFDHPTVETLAGYLATQDRQQPSIPLAETKALYALSPSQYNLWLAAQDPRRSIAYNLVAAFEVEGGLHEERLLRAIHRLVEEQEILRTNFIEREGQVYQLIRPAESAMVEWTSREVPADQLESALQHYVDQAFDLENDLLLKMCLLRSQGGPDLLVFCTHHLIMDGASLEVFTNTFLAYYNAKEADRPAVRLQLRFKDYSEWLNTREPEPAALDFWQHYLKDYRSGASMRPDRESSPPAGTNGAFIDLAFTLEETDKLRRLARHCQSTPHNVLAALLHLAVYQLTGRTDHVIGTVNSARNRPGLYGMIGMLV